MGVADEITLQELEHDPFPALARLRSESPVAFVPALGCWVVTRWDDAVHVCERADLFRSNTEPSWLRDSLGENMLTLDGDAHRRLADPMRAPFVGSGSGGQLAKELPSIFDALIDDFADELRSGGSIDLMTAYAEPLANITLQAALGFDRIMWQQLAGWCRGVCTGIANLGNDPQLASIAATAKAELGEALDDQLTHIRTHGGSGGLAHFVAAGLGHDEIVNNVRLMISGGINEPRDGVGLVMHVLLTIPEVMASVRKDPALLRKVVEETFRFHSPVGTATRQAVTDVDIAGTAIPAGALVSAMLNAANRDPARWTEPDVFRVDRAEGPHLAFAIGEHRCLGEWIGRQQVRIGVERLLARFENIELAEPAVISGFEFRGPTSLHVRLGPQAADPGSCFRAESVQSAAIAARMFSLDGRRAVAVKAAGFE